MSLLANAGDLRDTGSIPGLGRSPGRGHGNPVQYSCQTNPMDKEAWWAIVHRVTKSQTQLQWLNTAQLLSLSDPSTTPWTLANHTPLSMGFLRQEYWSGLPFPSPEDFPNPGFEPMSSAMAGGFFTTELPGTPIHRVWKIHLISRTI